MRVFKYYNINFKNIFSALQSHFTELCVKLSNLIKVCVHIQKMENEGKMVRSLIGTNI